MLLEAGRPDDARQLLEKIDPFTPDHIWVAEMLEGLLIKQGKLDEADKLSERIHELHRIYRR